MNNITDNKLLMRFKYLAFLPVLLSFFLMIKYWVSIISWDEWIMVSLGALFKEGNLSFVDLWQSHNEHRIFFPKIVYLLLAFLSDFDTRVQMFFSFLVVCLGYFFIAKYLFSTVKDEFARYLGFFVVALLLFSPVQYGNFLWGFQIGFFMTAFLPVLAFYFMHIHFTTNKISRMILALILAFMASFSSAQGLLTWPIVIVMMLINFGKISYKKKIFWIWLLFGIFSWILYFFHFDKMNMQGDHFTYVIKYPIDFIKYVFMIFATPFSQYNTLFLSVLFSCIIIVISVFSLIIFVRNCRNNIFFPGAIVLFGLITTVMISYGRANLKELYPSRYTTFTLLFYVGMVLLFNINKNTFINIKYLKYLPKLFLLFIILASFLRWPTAMAGYKQKERELSDQVKVLSNFHAATNEELAPIYPWPDAIKDDILFLEKNQYNVFKDIKLSDIGFIYDAHEAGEGGWTIYRKYSQFETFVDYGKTINVNLYDFKVNYNMDVFPGNIFRTDGVSGSYIYFELNDFFKPSYILIDFEQIPETELEFQYTHSDDYWTDYEVVRVDISTNADNKCLLKFPDDARAINRIRIGFLDNPPKEFRINTIRLFTK